MSYKDFIVDDNVYTVSQIGDGNMWYTESIHSTEEGAENKMSRIARDEEYTKEEIERYLIVEEFKLQRLFMLVKFDIKEYVKKNKKKILENLYFKILESANVKYDNEKYAIDVTAFSFSLNDFKILHDAVKKEVFKEMKMCSDIKKGKEFGYIWLYAAPIEDSKVEDGFVKIRDKFTVKKSRL